MRTADFYRFMREREQVRLNREAGLSWPWSNDPILQEFKFTNVHREHDRTTIEFRKIYDENAEAPREEQLLNCAIHRYFGTYEFARALGWQDGFHPKRIKALATKRLAAGDRVFTGAYVITNQGIKAPKQQVVTDVFLAGLWAKRQAILDTVDRTGRWRQVIELLAEIPGFGGTGFMAKELVLDTMFTRVWPHRPVDFNEWCPLGPGARRGMNRVMEQPKDGKISPALGLSTLRTLCGMQVSLWPTDWQELCLHDIQFQLCEFDKYERVRMGEGRPRSRYKVQPRHSHREVISL